MSNPLDDAVHELLDRLDDPEQVGAVAPKVFDVSPSAVVRFDGASATITEWTD